MPATKSHQFTLIFIGIAASIVISGAGCSMVAHLSPTTTMSGTIAATSTTTATTTFRSPPFVPPLDQALLRITKKPFGIFITPSTSPVQPERFHGYHTGVDFETFPDEQNTAVAVHAICSGKLLRRAWASGCGHGSRSVRA